MERAKFTQEQKEDENILFIYGFTRKFLKSNFDLDITVAEAVILKEVIREIENENRKIIKLREKGVDIREGIEYLAESIDRLFKRAYGVDRYQYEAEMRKVFPGVKFNEKLEKFGGMSLWQRLGKMIKEEREKREMI